MYTNVKLPEDGAYTNRERSLQGASPPSDESGFDLFAPFQQRPELSLALLYNLQGRRIHAVGVSQLGDIKQQTVHTMNFTASYAINSRLNVNLRVDDLLNRDIVFKQDVPSTNEVIEVERYKEGTSFEVGFSFNL